MISIYKIIYKIMIRNKIMRLNKKNKMKLKIK